MSDVLERILARKREEILSARVAQSHQALREQCADAPPPRGFEAALRARAASGPAVIAEIKKASPSKGLIRPDFDPDWLARRYAHGGAACLSVLTDIDFFQGAPGYLTEARAACELPVLRKDFIIDPYQLLEARAWGADCVLLIVAALAPGALRDLHAEARELGLDVLVEVHDGAELEVAQTLPGALLGINNRNLRTFETTLQTTIALMPDCEPGRFVISESGIATADDIRRLHAAGVGGFLIGEHLMRQPDPGDALSSLLSTAA